MKTLLFLSTVVLATTSASAQNTASINQQGSNQEVTIVQEGAGNTSIISQSNQVSNRAVISQSGVGNTATIHQSNSVGSGKNQSISVSQSGDSETVINQTDGSNSISIHQRSTPSVSPTEEPQKKGIRRNSIIGRKRKTSR